MRTNETTQEVEHTPTVDCDVFGRHVCPMSTAVELPPLDSDGGALPGYSEPLPYRVPSLCSRPVDDRTPRCWRDVVKEMNP